MNSERPSLFPRRPPRFERLFSALAPFYFITFNTWKRLPLLGRPEIHEAFRTYCLRAAAEHDVAVGRYVIMADHIHLFVYLPPTEVTLERWIRMLRTVLGKELLRLDTQKPHWQEGFFDHLLRSSESYAQKWEYVRMNPVRAGFCQEPEAWPYQGEIASLRYE
jgi:REP element-mobilizing transposase RayT